MSCMNFTSASEGGGNVARVEDGSVRVGCPGAPGWTTIGAGGSTCCAETDSASKHAKAPATRYLFCFIGVIRVLHITISRPRKCSSRTTLDGISRPSCSFARIAEIAAVDHRVSRDLAAEFFRRPA